MKRLATLAVGFMCICLLGGCSKEPTVEQTAKDLNKPTGVKWDELRALDELAEKGEALTPGDDPAAMRALANDIKAAAAKLAAQAPPMDAAEKAEVIVLQKDLGNLAQNFGDTAAMSKDDLIPAIQAFHPVVEKLMGAAGMAHVHPEEKGHDTK